MNIIYIDRLSLFSMVAVIRAGMDYSNIFYFNTSSSAENLSNILTKTGLLKVRPQPVEFCLADIRDERGEFQFIRITEDIKDICLEISDKEFANNGFLKEFSQYFDFGRVLLFFEKVLADEINDIVIFINAVRWHARYKVGSASGTTVFFLERGTWSRYLSQYAARQDIKSVEYTTLINSACLNYLGRGVESILSRIKSRLNVLGVDKGINKKAKQPPWVIDRNAPLISAWYTGRAVTFDLKKRSDFFWLLKSDIPRERTLIYFDRTDIPATEEAVDTLNKEGVRFLALSGKAVTSNNIPLWHPGEKYREMKRCFDKLVLRNFLLNSIRLNPTPLSFLVYMLYFVKQYSYWYDFFSSNNIKVHVSPNDFTKLYMPKNLALERCGGVSISYQWSNLSFSSIKLSGGSNIMFSFGPAYRWVWEKNRSSIDSLVYCGYITDYSFKEVREDSLRLREELFQKGAKFIICFFDENSSSDRMSIVPNNKSADIYKYLIERVLEDGTLGLIFKPGYPKTLYKRLSSISSVIEKGKASGRCIFIDRGSFITEQYPTEAAQAADVCVGLLLSGTVALESYLSGTPTVFLDLERLYSNPVYQWGKEKVVFDSLDDLFSVIQRFRENPKSVPGFGDLSSWAKDRDPFKDGGASLRMGQYIGWLLEMFNQGRTMDEAIRYANQRYAEAWGAENVVRIEKLRN